MNRDEKAQAIEEIAAQIESISGYKTESWQEANENFLKIFRIQTIVTYFITGALLAGPLASVAGGMATHPEISPDNKRLASVEFTSGYAAEAYNGSIVVRDYDDAAGPFAACVAHPIVGRRDPQFELDAPDTFERALAHDAMGCDGVGQHAEDEHLERRHSEHAPEDDRLQMT